MVGPSGGGKTTVLYRLKTGETVTTIPTTGFNVETLTAIQGVEFTVWDVGGNWNYHGGLWRHYVQGTDAVICVVDSSDVHQIDQARNSLWRLYEEHATVLRDSVLLVFANKQDCLGAVTVREVKDRLGLEVQSEGRRWHIRGSVATTGDGLMEGMEWMATQFSKGN